MRGHCDGCLGDGRCWVCLGRGWNPRPRGQVTCARCDESGRCPLCIEFFTGRLIPRSA